LLRPRLHDHRLHTPTNRKSITPTQGLRDQVSQLNFLTLLKTEKYGTARDGEIGTANPSFVKAADVTDLSFNATARISPLAVPRQPCIEVEQRTEYATACAAKKWPSRRLSYGSAICRRSWVHTLNQWFTHGAKQVKNLPPVASHSQPAQVFLSTRAVRKPRHHPSQ
jgi:hypothetical protein